MYNKYLITESSVVKTRNQTIKVTQPDRARGQKIVNVKTKVFDKAFSGDTSMYVGRGGRGGIGNRYDMFGAFVNGGDIDIGDGIIIPQEVAKSIEVAEVHVDTEGNVTFTNGRHRWAWLRDQGATKIPVSMSQDSVVNAKKFGMI